MKGEKALCLIKKKYYIFFNASLIKKCILNNYNTINTINNYTSQFFEVKNSIHHHTKSNEYIYTKIFILENYKYIFFFILELVQAFKLGLSGWPMN